MSCHLARSELFIAGGVTYAQIGCAASWLLNGWYPCCNTPFSWKKQRLPCYISRRYWFHFWTGFCRISRGRPFTANIDIVIDMCCCTKGQGYGCCLEYSFFTCLINELIPGSNVSSWDANNYRLAKETVGTLWKSQFHYCLHKIPSLLFIATQFSAVPSCLASLCHTHFSVILRLSVPNFVIRTLFRQNVLLVGHACYMFRPFPTTCISCVNKMGRPQIMKLFLITQDFPFSKAQILPPTSSLYVRPHKTTHSQFTCDLFSPVTISEVCCRPGRSWLIWTSPYWSPALDQTERVSRNLFGQATDKD